MHIEQVLLLMIVLLPLALAMSGRMRVDVAAMSMAAVLGLLQFFGLGMLSPAATSSRLIALFAGLAAAPSLFMNNLAAAESVPASC